MSLVERVKAWPMPELPWGQDFEAWLEVQDGDDIAFAFRTYARTAREAVAAEADREMAQRDATIEMLCVALEDLLDTGFTGGPQGKRARAALSEARKT